MPKATLKVKGLSGFDKSFRNILTSKCGTLVPILTDELIPGSKVHLKTAIQASLPPLATDTFMNVDLKLEAFFVPTRLLYGGFWEWMSKQSLKDYDSGDDLEVGCPYLLVQNLGSDFPLIGAGSLADYLGFRHKPESYTDQGYNIFPFLAYHRIYDDWYRHPLIQTPVFNKPMGGHSAYEYISALPFGAIDQNRFFQLTALFNDGVKLGELRQRNFGFDYFTTALPNPQMGEPVSVHVSVQGEDPNFEGSFTIASLRAANSLQLFAERMEMAGPREQDFIKANYGVELSSGVAQRALYLGSASIPVYSKGVSTTATGDPTGTSESKNPFAASVGSQFGQVVCNGQVDLIDNFEVQETGYLMVIASLVPKVTYASGIDRIFSRYTSQNSQPDMANSLLENTGMQPIYGSELTGAPNFPDHIFGYAQRYADWKIKLDQIHGEIRDERPLEAFALQRSVDGFPTISSEFLKIPTGYLDQVAAVGNEISQYGCWIDCFHSYHVAQPLSTYVIPSLEDVSAEHSKDVTIDIGGSRL